MSYQTLLVYVGLASQVKSLLNVAQQIADKGENVHVIGLHVIPQIPVYPDMAFMVTSEMADLQRDALLKQKNEVKEAFETEMEKMHVSWEWRVVEANGKLVADRVLEHGRCVDLIIGAQDDPENDNDTQHGIAEQVMIRAGRPVLFVPYAGHFDAIGKKIMVAWNGSRESARATFDALPLLEKADHVEIIWSNPQNFGEDGLDLPGSEIANVLARHDITVEASQTSHTEIAFADELLSRLADQGFDLLVMGGYGHSRFREFVFGGATRLVLKQMTVPVLMSH
ncbi:MAG: universal stress protein [Gammaproteobacteria bacterium]|nr:universal stress protein [Gammaproteobacteria bacterium]